MEPGEEQLEADAALLESFQLQITPAPREEILAAHVRVLAAAVLRSSHRKPPAPPAASNEPPTGKEFQGRRGTERMVGLEAAEAQDTHSLTGVDGNLDPEELSESRVHRGMTPELGPLSDAALRQLRTRAGSARVTIKSFRE